jgi:hypothetical protein
MSFSIAPKGASESIPTVNARTNLTSSQAESRARAIAMLSAQGSPSSANAPSADAINAAVTKAPETPTAATPRNNETPTDSQVEASSSETPSEAASEQTIEASNSSETPDSSTTSTTTPEKDSLSSQYAQLARKEKALRAKMQEIKAKEDAFKTREQAIEQQYSQKLQESQKAWRDKLSQDPLSVMQETGLTYEQLTEKFLNAPNQQDSALKSTIEELRNEIKSLRDSQEKTTKGLEESQTQAYNQAINQMKTEAKKLVFSDDNYEMVKETNSINDVVELIEETFKKDGTLLTVEEAAQAVEDYLVEEALKLTKIKKLQARLKTPASSGGTAQTLKTVQQSNGQTEQGKQPTTQTMKTLTNSVGSTRQLSARERAMLAFKGELK